MGFSPDGRKLCPEEEFIKYFGKPTTVKQLMSNAKQTADELDKVDSKMEKMGLMETNVTLDVYDKIALFIKVINHAESR